MSTADAFEWFAEWAEDTSPLYTKLARHIARDEFLLDVASEAPSPNTRPHLLFAGVHAQLLDGADTPLREYYPSVVDNPRDPDDDAIDHFHDFVASHETDIRYLVGTRRTQTNAVRRTAALYPAFAFVADHAAPSGLTAGLALLEVGPSAGLNLRWDDYRYDYGDQIVGNPGACATIESAVEDGQPPLPGTPPRVTARLGVDVDPLDVTDPADVTWLRALVWPEHADRHDLLDDVVPVVSADPPEIVHGDAIDRLPGLLERLPEDATRVVYNTQVLYQVSDEEREHFREDIRALGREHPLYWISGEGAHPDYDEAIELTISRAANGDIEDLVVAAYQQHGRWIAWPDDGDDGG